MLNRFLIKNKLSVPLLAVATALFSVIAPESAMAAGFSCMNGDLGLFMTIACKITTTLYDIRKIVYVIGGFGLIAFTFAAIFNKISFKHLANIGISLFLLSMMTPFIEYFTQDPGHTLKFHDKLPTDYAEEANWAADAKCTPETCPKMDGILSGENKLGVGDIGGGIAMPGSIGSGIKFDDIGIKADGALPRLSAEAPDQRNFWQKAADFGKKVAKKAKQAKKTYDMVRDGVELARDAVGKAQGIGEAFKNMNGNPNSWFNAVKTAANAGKSIIDGTNSTMGHYQTWNEERKELQKENAANNPKAAARQQKRDERKAERQQKRDERRAEKGKLPKEEGSGWKKVKDALQDARDVASGVDEAAGTGQDFYNTAVGAAEWGKDVINNF